jgi:hypothetical protein
MIPVLILVLLAWLGVVTFLVACLAKVLNGCERRLTALEAATGLRSAPAPPAAG